MHSNNSHFLTRKDCPWHNHNLHGCDLAGNKHWTQWLHYGNQLTDIHHGTAPTIWEKGLQHRISGSNYTYIFNKNAIVFLPLLVANDICCLSKTALVITIPVLLNIQPASYSMGCRSSFPTTCREYTQKYLHSSTCHHGMHSNNFTLWDPFTIWCEEQIIMCKWTSPLQRQLRYICDMRLRLIQIRDKY